MGGRVATWNLFMGPGGGMCLNSWHLQLRDGTLFGLETNIDEDDESRGLLFHSLLIRRPGMRVVLSRWKLQQRASSREKANLVMNKHLQSIIDSVAQALTKPVENAPQEHVDLHRLKSPIVSSLGTPVASLFGSPSSHEDLLERYEHRRHARTGSGDDYLH
jgi:hypothetical protein